jgi:hypothetical protein
MLHVDRLSRAFTVLSALIFSSLSATAQTETFSFTIDAGIFQGPSELADTGQGARPLAAVADGHGIVSRFISNEVIFADSPAALPAFLTKYNGQVISTIHPPVGAAAGPVPFFQPASVVRVDASGFSLQNLTTDAAKIGVGGANKFSSDVAARLVAMVTSEEASGSKVALNFVSESLDFLTSTTEQADRNGVSNAFQWPEFDTKAWEFVSAHNFARRARVAIIDGGFWLNSNGVPCEISPDALCGTNLTTHGASDLPSLPLQYDTTGNGGSFAGGTNPNSCTGGSPCPWHGNGTVSVVAAVLNNSAGAAGTGGQVADPILLKSNGADDSAAAGILDAQGFNADIVNMSFGGSCNDWCRVGHSLGVINGIFDGALDSGILLVAAAGNDAADAGQRQEWPCQYSSGSGNSVYCVGALNSKPDQFGYFTKTDGTGASYSNSGDAVSIFAPTNIHVIPSGSSNGALTFHNGTSAAAPYVSGVAAMMKALNPNLDANGIKNILNNTASMGTCWYWNGYWVAHTIICPYPNSFAKAILEPYAAVVSAAGGYSLQPEIQITAPLDGATVQAKTGVPVAFTITAADVQDGTWPLKQYGNPNPTPIRCSSDVDGPIGCSNDFTYAPEGLRHITATVTNSNGISNSATIAVTIKFNHVTPSPVITWPPPNTTVPSGSYTVTGYAKSTDPGVLGNFDCSKLVWNNSVPAVPVPNSSQGMCEAQLNFNGPTETVTLSATDRLGDTGSTSTTVKVSGQTQSQLAVQILNPLNGASVRIIPYSAYTIGLSGNAAPLLDNSNATYSWWWYYTAKGPATHQQIGQGQNTTWDTQKAGLCQAIGTEQVAIELDVNDSTYPGPHLPHQPPKNPVQTVSGSATANIQLMCSAFLH